MTEPNEPTNARDQLIKAYRTCEDAEEAKAVAKGGGYVNPYKDRRIKQCFQLYVMALTPSSSELNELEDVRVNGWASAREVLREVVATRLDPSMQAQVKAVLAYLERVQDLVEEQNPTYVSPPEIQ